MLNGQLNPGSWEVRFIEATSELLKQGWSYERLAELFEDVVDAEEIFSDEAEAS